MEIREEKADVLISKLPIILLLFSYCIIFSVLLSHDHAWMQYEQIEIKFDILKEGTSFNRNDLKRGFDWQLFEDYARTTRFLSSYFEIVDTKVRVWLWNFFPPHPSFSLTWIFSLLLSPLLFVKLLDNLDIKRYISITLVSFYLLTPGFLSCVVMLFRPAKAMTNFSIILCLYLASCLSLKFKRLHQEKSEIDHYKKTERKLSLQYIALLSVMFFSFFWDETAILIFPAVFLMFPNLILNQKRALLALCLPIATYYSYTQVIPWIMNALGYDLIKHDNYLLLQQDYAPESIQHFLQYFIINAKLLLLDTLGIVPVSEHAHIWTKSLQHLVVFFVYTFTAFLILNFYQKRNEILTKRNSATLLLWVGGIFALLFFHQCLMFLTNVIWGPYWYGAYWSIFFCIILSKLLRHIQRFPILIFVCFAVLLVNLSGVFIETNKVYKKFHYYPLEPLKIRDLFVDKEQRFDLRTNPEFTGDQIKAHIRQLWLWKKKGKPLEIEGIPLELFGIAIELDPQLYDLKEQYEDSELMIGKEYLQ